MPKSRILIVSNLLTIGGAEKLIYELVVFARQNNIEPTILILDNYKVEYYDKIYKEIKVNVVRTRLHNIKHLRAPFKMLRSIYWVLLLKFFTNNFYESVHLMGLYNLYQIKALLKHKHRFFWHVTNAIQCTNGTYDFPSSYFDDERDTIVCINRYQINELIAHYGHALKCNLRLFKLFIND
ncbi:glycosyltransferase family protein [Mucilaginibacter segetis]|uniref:Uncharacterized protein n=1 Tax=Mucilaginibacter segetis TaxID=2793071 RepID=A0A934PRP1_9SPHI|nr:hypothetical protein [Mucilaginibacter segetis]MBK0378207.1 hypothetical protein [Mucilaginibacter segetis]